MLVKYIVFPKKSAYSNVFSVQPEPITTLWYLLHSVPDHRRAQGRRHDLATLLTLAILAMCCGHLSYLAMQEWCENYQDHIQQQIPFLAKHLPNSATFYRVFAKLNTAVFEEIVGKWFQAIMPVAQGEGISLDGKEIHGTGLCLVAAFAHQAKAVLFEGNTDTKGKELVVGPEVVRHISVSGHVITGDALFAQRKLCEQITTAQGGYVFRVKGNQETVENDIRLFFADPPFQAKIDTHTSVDRWKGVKEIREVRVSDQITAYLCWPGLTHVWYMKKTVIKHGNSTITESVGIVRLPEDILGKRQLAEAVSEYIRGHWSIETSLHGKRDVSFNEDRSMIRTGHAPHTMAILRNMVINIFHRGTVRNFKTAMRRFAAKPEELFDFLGLTTVTQPALCA